MSKVDPASRRTTLLTIKKMMAENQRISMITCYDSSFAKLIDKSSIDMILVGDSLGNVMLGFENTLRVTIDHMVHHASAVTRATQRAFVVADMPFMGYWNVEEAVKNATRLIAEGGAQAVKLEGGSRIIPQAETLVSSGIPVMGHLGLTPQSINQLGGHRVQGRSDEAARTLVKDAESLQRAGVFAIVAELIPEQLGKRLQDSLEIPVIGIGAGSHCAGQVLVLQDLLGMDADFNPRFLKKYCNLSEVVGKALSEYDQDVKEGRFPADEHSL